MSHVIAVRDLCMWSTEQKEKCLESHFKCVYSPPPQVLINFASVMTTCVCSAARVTSVDVCSHACRQPPAAHRPARRGTDSGFGRFDLATVLPLNSFPPSVFPSSSDRRRRHSPFSCVASKLPGVQCRGCQLTDTCVYFYFLVMDLKSV